MKAAGEQRRAEIKRNASFVAMLLNVSGKVLNKPTSADELLGWKKPKKAKSLEQLQKEAARKGRTYADYVKQYGE